MSRSKGSFVIFFTFSLDRFVHLKIIFLHLRHHYESALADANRAERHGGKTMRVLADQNVQSLSAIFPSRSDDKF